MVGGWETFLTGILMQSEVSSSGMAAGRIPHSFNRCLLSQLAFEITSRRCQPQLQGSALHKCNVEIRRLHAQDATTAVRVAFAHHVTRVH